MFPSKSVTRQDLIRIAERQAKTIFIHHYMDRHDFDLERLMKCCHHYPQIDGRIMPACGFNMFHRGAPRGPIPRSPFSEKARSRNSAARLIPAKELESYALHPVVGKYARHVNPAFVDLLNVLGYGRVFARARDVWLWDHRDNRYLDCLAAFGTMNLGHNHPRLLERLEGFLKTQALNHFHIGPSPFMAELAERLAQSAAEPLEVALFCSSGAEAVEAAMKLAQAATGRHKFVYCTGGYHGTSLGTLGIMETAANARPSGARSSTLSKFRSAIRPP